MGIEYDPDARPVDSINIVQRPGLPYLSQASRWSCMPTAFAMVLAKHDHARAGKVLSDIMKRLGRDDERGFHVQEFLGFSIGHCYTFTMFEFDPKVELAPGLSRAPLVLFPVRSIMRHYDGVLLGVRKGAEHHHAVAWCWETQMCLDPEAGVYNLDDFEPEIFLAHMEVIRALYL